MAVRKGETGGRRGDGNDVAVRLLAFGWVLAAIAVGLSAAWSMFCGICGTFFVGGGDFPDLLAFGPLVISLIYVAGLGAATGILWARHRRGAAESRGYDGRR
jgi:hypothetical protein